MYIILPAMYEHVEIIDEAICISILIEDEKLLERYNKIWEKENDSIKNEFDSKSVESEKQLKIFLKIIRVK